MGFKYGPFILVIALMGCAQTHKAETQGDELTNSITVGKVQRELKTGMPGSDVVAILGSPNIVTRDKNKMEVWIYDKISTNYTFSNSSGKLALTLYDLTLQNRVVPQTIFGSPIVLGGGNAALNGAGASYNRSAGASSMNQKTLTILIKMNGDGLVDDFTYHASSF
jgi:hypothetical protein